MNRILQATLSIPSGQAGGSLWKLDPDLPTAQEILPFDPKGSKRQTYFACLEDETFGRNHAGRRTWPFMTIPELGTWFFKVTFVDILV